MQFRVFLLAALLEACSAFTAPLSVSQRTSCAVASSATDEFANFAASLEEPVEEQLKQEYATKNKSWQEDLEELMDPGTPLARKQILMTDLMSANQDIQDSMQAALRDRKVSQDY